MTTAYGHDRRYDYTYDALGFLTEAKYSSTDSVKDFSALYTYDRQANLTSMLQRNKTTQFSLIQMPRKIKREGNRIVSTEVPSPFLPSEPVPDPVVKTGGKEPVEGGIIEIDPRPVLPWFNGKNYGYDANGNLTHDRDRSIAAIAYNAVDRPKSVRFAGGDVTRYVYSATGERLAEVHASRDGLSDVRRMRLGAFCFTDGRLERTELPQGYLDTLGTLHLYIPDFQGNIVGVCREGGGLEQFTDYYPYGTPHPDARHPEVNRRKYGGKELLTEGGLNEYDFEARRLTPLASFSQPDPLASNYPWLSPYAYCAADPINLTDPSGMEFTPNAMRWAEKIKTVAQEKIDNNNKSIESRQERINGGGLSQKKIEKIEKQIQQLQSQNTELENAKSEIDALEKSSQVYDVRISDRYGSNIGKTEFDYSNGAVIAFLPTAADIPLAAHEFKHFFQFENGEMSIGPLNEDSNFYDKYDELAAYKRGEVFGGESYKGISDLPSQYKDLPNANLTIYNHPSYAPLIQARDKQAFKQYNIISTKYNAAFRVKGNTYYRQRK